jgi:tetratricopeptide (TPR) repeat protein
MISSLKSPEASSFLSLNQQVFAELVTFVDFAEGLTIAFLDVNFATDGDLLIAALRQNPICEGIRFEVFNLSRQPDLRFLRDELVQRLSKIKLTENQKLVVIVRGLEAAIGTDGIGEYPPVLQDLNFVRDAYSTSVPYPILFVLPDYAITRIAKYAPDFWAWRSGVFTFKTLEKDREGLLTQVLEQPLRIASSEQNQEQIEQLKQLLMEYRPSGKAITPEHLVICSELDYKLGVAYLTQRQPGKARDYLEEARRNYQQALDIYVEYGDRLCQAKTYNNLGVVAQYLQEYKEARHNYQQALDIFIEYSDRFSQASTYYNLGSVAQDLREHEEARRNYQQALDIFIEYGDRFSQAGTYYHLGQIAETLSETEEAKAYYLQDLEITVEFNNEAGLEASLNNLARFYRITQDPTLLESAAPILGTTAAELQQAMILKPAKESPEEQS